MELMKNRHCAFRIFLTFIVFLIAGNADAQSVVDSMPSIPKNATVITPDGQNSLQYGGQIFWVNPGFDFDVFGGTTVFAEPGCTIVSACDRNLIYLKPGARCYAMPGDSVVNVTNFDYTNAPPNPAHSTSGVKSDLKSVPFTVTPNPTDGMLSVQGLPLDNITVSAFNSLGETVLEQKIPPAPNFTLDLSKLAPGTYYIRFSSANSVMTKNVVRE